VRKQRSTYSSSRSPGPRDGLNQGKQFVWCGDGDDGGRILRDDMVKLLGAAQLHLNRTPENEAALKLAIELLRTGTMSNMEVDKEARIALSKDEEYIQSLISSAEMKKRQRQLTDEQAVHEFEQLLLKLD
jgi:hypothetical protein